MFHAGAGGVANFVTTRVRREFIHPLPPAGYYPCLRGRVSYYQDGYTPYWLSPWDRGDEREARRGCIVSTYSFSVRLRHLFCFCFPLRPLRPLREIKIIAYCFSRRGRKERKVLFSFVFHACAGGVANFVTTRVRREFIHPSPPVGYSPVSGVESVTTGTVFGVQLVFRHRTDDVLSKYPIAGSFGCLILLTNSSKIVDENGEPLVVYHGSPRCLWIQARQLRSFCWH